MLISVLIKFLFLNYFFCFLLCIEDDKICPQKCFCSEDKNLENVVSSYVVNCTEIEFSNLDDNYSTKPTKLYLNKILISKENPIKINKNNQLKFLELNQNSIEFIDENAFNNLKHLETLKLVKNELSFMPKAINKIKNLKNLYIKNNKIKSLELKIFSENINLELIEIQEYNIESINNNVFKNLPNLKKIKLSSLTQLNIFPNLSQSNLIEELSIDRCELRYVPSNLCEWLPNLKSINFKSNHLTSVAFLENCINLQHLDLSYNYISSLNFEIPFFNLKKLYFLFLNNNLIEKINEKDFESLQSLEVLNLQHNLISFIHPKAFSFFKNLVDLNLGGNKFSILPTEGLQNVVNLKTFNNYFLKEFPSPINFPKVKKLALSYAYHCCEFIKKKNDFFNVINLLDKQNQVYEKVTWLDLNMVNKQKLENVTDEGKNLSLKNDIDYENYFFINKNIECVPEPSPFMPCEDLFDFWTLRCSVWLVFLLAVLGNASVIIVLLFGRMKLDVPRFLVCNLAWADFLMGIYLSILALVDSTTLTMFRSFAVTWQNSALCSIAGFLAVFSAELSVYTLAVITLERNYAITNAMHLNKRLSLKNASIIMIVGHTFVFALAVLPLFGISSYQKFAVCLPFEIEDDLSRFYVLSLVIFNGLAFLILTGCYLRMYCAIRGSQAWNSNDTRIAKRMALLVFTDFLCWFPIATCTISSAFFGVNLIDLSQAKIFTIFILPLNSCANPFLYAIFTKQFKKDCVLLCKKLEESQITRGIGGCKHSSNFSNHFSVENSNSYNNKLITNQFLCCNSLKCPNYINLIQKNVCHDQNEFFVETNAHCALSPKLNFSNEIKKKNLFKEENLISKEKFFQLDFSNNLSKKNCELVIDKIDNGSKLVCKCGIETVFPKSKFYLKNSDSLKEDCCKNNLETSKEMNKSSSVIKINNLSKTNYDSKNNSNLEMMEKKNLFKKMFEKILNSKINSKDENSNNNLSEIKKDCLDCKNLQKTFNNEKTSNSNEVDTDNLHKQLLKSKQRLDSISSENFSSRSDSWKQQASLQLKLIEKYFFDKSKSSTVKSDRKNSCATGSCSTSTFRISRSSVSSENFKPSFLDKHFHFNDKKVYIDDDLKEKNKLDKYNQVNSELLYDLFEQFLCSDCAVKNNKLINKD